MKDENNDLKNSSVKEVNEVNPANEKHEGSERKEDIKNERINSKIEETQQEQKESD
jgi:hypothetical protein